MWCWARYPCIEYPHRRKNPRTWPLSVRVPYRRRPESDADFSQSSPRKLGPRPQATKGAQKSRQSVEQWQESWYEVLVYQKLPWPSTRGGHVGSVSGDIVWLFACESCISPLFTNPQTPDYCGACGACASSEVSREGMGLVSTL